MIERKAILERHEQLRTVRQRHETTWSAIAELIRPEDNHFSGPKEPSAAYDNLFDSTALYALRDFKGGIFSQATNPANKWFMLGVHDADMDRWQPARLWLERETHRLNLTLQPGVSGFYGAAPPWFADIGAFGNGLFYSEEQVGAGRFIDRAIPLHQAYVDVDANGNLDTVHRRWTMKARQARGVFPDLPETRDDLDLEFIHAVQPNPEFRPGRAGPSGMPFLSTYLCVDHCKEWRRDGGYREMPYFFPRWDERSGDPWGIGPAHAALPDMRSLQVMQQTTLASADFAANPPLLGTEEADFSAGDFVPGRFIAGGMNADGKPLVQPVLRHAQVGLTLQEKDALRQTVRNAFYFGLQSLVNRPQMTATEVMGFREEELRLMAPHLARLQHEGLSPFITRRWRILQRAGQVPPPPPELEGHELKVTYISPLAKAQQAAEGRATMGWINAVASLAPLRPEVMDHVDVDAAAGVLHEALGPPARVLLDPAKVEENRRARAAAAARQQQLAEAEQMTAIGAEQAHARQAETLSRQRLPA